MEPPYTIVTPYYVTLERFDFERLDTTWHWRTRRDTEKYVKYVDKYVTLETRVADLWAHLTEMLSILQKYGAFVKTWGQFRDSHVQIVVYTTTCKWLSLH